MMKLQKTDPHIEPLKVTEVLRDMNTLNTSEWATKIDPQKKKHIEEHLENTSYKTTLSIKQLWK